VLDPEAAPPDLERASVPLDVLAARSLAALRRARGEPLRQSGAARLEDIVLVVSGAFGSDRERRLALLAAALSGVRPSAHTPQPRAPHAAAVGIDAATARLLLACQLSEDEAPGSSDVFERAERVASLVLRGNVALARVVADRELRRRGLALLEAPAPSSRSSRSTSALALACLFPLDETSRAALGRAVSRTPALSPEGGST
jgi:hypothetical protein